MKKLKRSKLSPYEGEISKWHNSGCSYREISERVKQKHGIDISHNAVFSFLKVRARSKGRGVPFYSGLPEDIKESLLKQLNILWTHESTAIEGNTLTLGETANVLELGLTINGKSLREHEEVYGHSKAIELIMDLLEKDKVETEDIFNLHRCVIQKTPIDSMRPVGDWKSDYNGTTGIRNGKPVYMEFSSPSDTPKLMSHWLKELNRKLYTAHSPVQAVNVYSWIHITFVRIHPFFDGNGRIARLIANLPLLKCGHPPLLVSSEKRVEYINKIWEYQNAVGVLKAGARFLPADPTLNDFKNFVRKEWQNSLELVAEARKQSEGRSR